MNPYVIAAFIGAAASGVLAVLLWALNRPSTKRHLDSEQKQADAAQQQVDAAHMQADAAQQQADAASQQADDGHTKTLLEVIDEYRRQLLDNRSERGELKQEIADTKAATAKQAAEHETQIQRAMVRVSELIKRVGDLEKALDGQAEQHRREIAAVKLTHDTQLAQKDAEIADLRQQLRHKDAEVLALTQRLDALSARVSQGGADLRGEGVPQ